MIKTSRRRNKKKAIVAVTDATRVPQLATSVKYTHTFRFIATANITSRSLIFTELLDLLCLATSAASASRIVNAVKIKRVQVWAATSVATSSLSVIFQKNGSGSGQSGDSITYADTALGVSQVAHIDVKFNAREQVGQWQGASITAAYGTLTIPQGGVIDITVSHCLIDTETVFNVTGAVAGATLGRVYCRALDNNQATPQLSPSGWSTI